MDGGREVLLAGALTLAAQPQKGCSDGDGSPEQGQACMDVSLFPPPSLHAGWRRKGHLPKVWWSPQMNNPLPALVTRHKKVSTDL